MYLLSVCSPRPGSLGCPATAAQATSPSTWPPTSSSSNSAPSQVSNQADHSPRGSSAPSAAHRLGQQAAAAAAMLLDGARRAAPGALRPPPLRIWGAWVWIQAQAPQILGCPQDFLSTSRILPTRPYHIYCHLWFLSPMECAYLVNIYCNGDRDMFFPLDFLLFCNQLQW